MKNLLFALFAFLLSVQLNAQNVYPQGAYLSLNQLFAKETPATDYGLVVQDVRDTKLDQDEFILVSPDKSIKKKFVRKEIWAFSDGETLYINCLRHQIQTSFAQVISHGKYLLFWAGPTQHVAAGVAGGVAGGALGGLAVGGIMGKKRFVYFLDPASQKVTRVKQTNLLDIIKDRPDLVESYQAEPEDRKKSREVIMEYMIKYNEEV